jgi:PAS domain S-box-containing protein
MEDHSKRLKAQIQDELEHEKRIDTSKYETDLKVLVEKLSKYQIELEKQNQELVQSQELLKQSEERFQLLFNNAPLGYQSLDINGYFIDVNQQWLNTLGYEKDEVIGKWFGDFLTPLYQDGFRTRFPIFKEQGHIHSEFEMIHKNGSILFIAFDGRIGNDTNGNFLQTHCILKDITEQKKAEEKVIQIGKHYQALIDKAPDGIALIDAEGKFKYISESAKKMFGYSQKDGINLNPDENTHPDDLPMVLSELGKIFVDPSYIPTIEYRFKNKNGQWIWIETTFSNLLANENVEAIVLNFRDITERKVNETIFKEIVEKNPMSIQIINMEGYPIQTNTAHTNLFGVKPPSDYSVLKDPQLLEYGFDHFFDRIKKRRGSLLS